jgi:O-acetyl-ADP-ribose deacetylase (regulator of RNase III)
MCAGGALHCEHVIHAVGPDYYDYNTDAEADALLASAYKAAMAHAQRLGVRTLGFSLLSAAIYRAHRPLAVVLRIAVDALRAASYDGLEEVHLVGFTAGEVRTLLEAAAAAAQEAAQDAPQAAALDAAPAAELDATAAA